MPSKLSNRPKAIIVEAGTGGIATAARLAKSGVDVLVVEKNDFTGGYYSEIYHNNYKFDRGPTLVILRDFLLWTLDDLRTSLDEEGLISHKCEPNYTVYFHDQKSVIMSTDNFMKKQLEKWESNLGYERFLKYLHEGSKRWEFSVKEILNTNFLTILSALRPRFLGQVVFQHVFDSMAAHSTFRSIHGHPTISLLNAFDERSLSLPFDAAGIFTFLQYSEFTDGIWYPQDGYYEIPKTLMRISERYGAVYRLSAPVDKVLVSDDGRATGVKLSSGETIDADIVVLNPDIKVISMIPFPIIPSIFRPIKARLGRDPYCSGLSFYWGMNRTILELGSNTIFLAENYRESFEDILKSHIMPNDPCFFITVPSRLDSTAAPEGKESVIVFIPIGGFGKDQEAEAVERARNFIIDTIQK
ncbi:hypothetical protein Clacol_003078 [Clathrus columnatus]|uniref:Amine oxidase domain-containing protein n=1 Tax=Clathrus columnatus TaxID=1419009 RepID=A0AAV5A6L1_9AGAM|nr:hypothetical protein Clacol_003078 [Clathrus columnatus]